MGCRDEFRRILIARELWPPFCGYNPTGNNPAPPDHHAASVVSSSCTNGSREISSVNNTLRRRLLSSRRFRRGPVWRVPFTSRLASTVAWFINDARGSSKRLSFLSLFSLSSFLIFPRAIVNRFILRAIIYPSVQSSGKSAIFTATSERAAIQQFNTTVHDRIDEQ